MTNKSAMILELPVPPMRQYLAMLHRHRCLKHEFANLRYMSMHTPLVQRMYAKYQDEISEIERALISH